jgi:3-oxoacyl-[acyl-carrier protein] reductase
MTMGEQTALVTGAGSREGIGFAIARRLHSAGYHVAITSTTNRIHGRAHDLDPSGQGVSAFVADLTDEAAASELVASVLRLTGRIDVLVNNAGMAQTGKPAEDAADNVFSDGTDHEMLTVTGSVTDGFKATLTAVVSA